MALPSAVVQEGVNRVFSYISTKLDDKALTANTITRIDIALSRIDFVLEKTGKVAITHVPLLHRWKIFMRVHKEGMDLLNKYRPQHPDGREETGKSVVRSSSYLQRIAHRAANLSMSSLVGFSNVRLSPSIAKTFERYADSAEKFVTDVESGSPLNKTFRCSFLRYLFEGKTLWCEKMGKKPSQSLFCHLQPFIVQGRGVEVRLVYVYVDSRMPEKCFYLSMTLRISEDTDIIGITIECMEWWAALFRNRRIQSAIGEFKELPNLQGIFHWYDPPPSFVNDVKHVLDSKFFRPDPICCNENSCTTQSNKSSIQIPQPVIEIYFRCCISAPKNNSSSAPLLLDGCFAPHCPAWSSTEEICLEYGGKDETRYGSVQQLEEIARSDGRDYLVHEPDPTDYALFWSSPHGYALVTLEQERPRPGRRVSKRKR